MGTEIFRFVTIRPPQQLDPKQPPASIDLNVPGSELAGELRRARAGGARGPMVDVAVKFTASPAFIGAPSRLDAKVYWFPHIILVESRAAELLSARGANASGFSV